MAFSGIEVDGLAELSVSGDEIEIVEEPECSIDGVEGDAGYAVLHCVMDGFGVRVIGAGGNFAEDLEALLGEFDSCFVGFGLEVFDAALDFV